MSPNPQTPEAQEARQRGMALAAAHLLQIDLTPEVLAGLRKAVGAQRAKYLASGDWEGVWQAAGALDAIRAAQGEKML